MRDSEPNSSQKDLLDVQAKKAAHTTFFYMGLDIPVKNTEAI